MLLNANSRRAAPTARQRRWVSVVLVADFNVTPRRVLDRLECAGAWHARGDFSRALLGDPRQPVRPPRTGMFLGFGEPAVDIRVARFRPGPILVFVLLRRVDHAGDVPGASD